MLYTNLVFAKSQCLIKALMSLLTHFAHIPSHISNTLTLSSNLHGRTHRSSLSIRHLPRRRPRNPQRRRLSEGCSPVPRHLGTTARHRRDPAHQAHRLRHANLVHKNLGEEATAELAAFKGDFLPFSDLEAAVKEDVDFLKESKLIPEKIKISGWVYEVETGKVKSVV
jgi:hypothetical protein